MLTTLNSDFSSKEEILSNFLNSNAVSHIEDSWIVDISKFLREDLSINLEMLELALEFIADMDINLVFISGIDKYFSARGTVSEEKRKEELTFIMTFTGAVFGEFIDGGKVELTAYK